MNALTGTVAEFLPAISQPKEDSIASG